MKLTFQFLENNTTERLWDKCIEAYENYKPQERGGPLLFIIMMKRLQVDTDAAVEYLRNSVKTMKVTNFDGEDVSRVVSLIRGVWKRLKGVGESKVPSDFSKQILAVFQTSTVPEFNALFEHSNGLEIKTRTDPGKEKWPSPDVLFEMAESKYLELHQIDKWSGVTTKANQTVFNASAGAATITCRCFNCGSLDHSLPKCPKPRNEQQIEQRKTAFQKEKAAKSGKADDGKKKSGGNRREKRRDKTKGKFAEPTPAEKNRRKIDGKWFTYNPEKQRWFVERNPGTGTPPAAGTAPAAQQAVATPNISADTSATPTSGSPPGNDTLRAVREAAISNATQAITIAMRGMADAYRDN